MTFPIDNTAFQAMFLMGVFERDAYNYDPDAPLDDENIPELATEMNIIDIGPIRMLTIPGELLPELAIGGFDGSHTQIGDYTDPIVDLDTGQPGRPQPRAGGALPQGADGRREELDHWPGERRARLHHSGVQLHRR